jgi:hypothetical protein
MDVIIAFLNGVLSEEIYIPQPDGFVQPINWTSRMQLLKSLYGLKHASRIWYELFDKFL